jgi:hypothetical protein
MMPNFGILFQRDLDRYSGFPFSKGGQQKGGCPAFGREAIMLSDFLRPLIG